MNDARCICSAHVPWYLKQGLDSGMYLIRVENMQKVMTSRVYYQHKTGVAMLQFLLAG